MMGLIISIFLCSRLEPEPEPDEPSCKTASAPIIPPLNLSSHSSTNTSSSEGEEEEEEEEEDDLEDGPLNTPLSTLVPPIELQAASPSHEEHM